MPRLARLDALGVLQHVIARGIERREIFTDDKDRQSFLDRLGDILGETKTECFAWALIPNHFHLLVRTGLAPLSQVMRRLLTGYAVVFNRRHRRSGHLFQNRYKSMVCEEDPYLLELVRYIHLNPLRAGIVKDLSELDRYLWSGHSVLMGEQGYEWQGVEEVLLLFSDKIGKARRAYRRFVEQGIVQGRRPDLQRSGLLRKLRGDETAEEIFDVRVLGRGDFVQKVLGSVGELGHGRMRRVSLKDLIRKVSQTMQVEVSDLLSGSRRDKVSMARALVSYLAVREMGYSGVEVSRTLKLSGPGVTKCVEKGKNIIFNDENLRNKLIN